MNDQAKAVPARLGCTYPECASTFAPYFCVGADSKPNGAHLCPVHMALFTGARERLPIAVQELHALTLLMPDSYKGRDMEAVAAALPSDDIWHDIVRARKRVKEIRAILSNCRDDL